MVEEIKAPVDPDATFVELRLWYTFRDVISARPIHHVRFVVLRRDETQLWQMEYSKKQ